MLAAIEVYNKPTVEYREQTFAILATNAWEIILKARLVQQAGGKSYVIYQRKKKSRRYVRDDTGEPITINLREALGRTAPPTEVADNIRGLMAIRNEATHMGMLTPELRQKILWFGTASVRNFVKLSAKWFGENIETPYLLPVGFIGQAAVAKGISPKPQKELLKVLDTLSRSSNGKGDSDYSVAVHVQIELNRGISGGGSIGLTNDPSAPTVHVSDDEALERFPCTYTEIVSICKKRYPTFKQNRQFHQIMEPIKADVECAHERKLDPKSSKSAKKVFYNREATLARLDREYNNAT